MILKVGSLITCPRIGPGNFIISKEDTRTFGVKKDGAKGDGEQIYKVHCHPASLRDIIAHNASRIEKNQMIGRVKRPGRK